MSVWPRFLIFVGCKMKLTQNKLTLPTYCGFGKMFFQQTNERTCLLELNGGHEAALFPSFPFVLSVQTNTQVLE